MNSKSQSLRLFLPSSIAWESSFLHLLLRCPVDGGIATQADLHLQPHLHRTAPALFPIVPQLLPPPPTDHHQTPSLAGSRGSSSAASLLLIPFPPRVSTTPVRTYPQFYCLITRFFHFFFFEIECFLFSTEHDIPSRRSSTGSVQRHYYGNGNETENPNQRFSFEEIYAATKNFSPSFRIGQGGFGTVYKVKLRDGSTVAVKRAKKVFCSLSLSLSFALSAWCACFILSRVYTKTTVRVQSSWVRLRHWLKSLIWVWSNTMVIWCTMTRSFLLLSMSPMEISEITWIVSTTFSLSLKLSIPMFFERNLIFYR